MSRRSRIKLALFLALGFIALRLGYAFVFAGLQGNQVFLDLPTIQLSGPFRQVRLLGPVSLDGIIRNVELALPFALAILVFGLLASLANPDQLMRLGQRTGRLSWLVTTLGVALSTIPQLLRSAGEISSSLRLRGEKKTALLVPLMERTVARAMAVGLELARPKPLVVAPTDLRLQKVSVAPLKPVNLHLKPGSMLLITGATGSGKTTLLRAIAGEIFEHDSRAIQGQLIFGGKKLATFADAAEHCILVPQLPQHSFLEPNVTDSEFTQQLVGKPTSQLSHGEAYRFALAKALKRDSQVLLLDEPAAALDKAGIDQLREVIHQQLASGKILVVADHRAELFVDLATETRQLSGGELVPGIYEAEPIQVRRLPAIGTAEKSVELSLPAQEQLFGALNLALHQGECIAVTGGNGVGKTTLLSKIASSSSEHLKLHGIAAGARPPRVVSVPDRPENFFVTADLASELVRADRIVGSADGLTRLTLESILGRSVAADLERHPLDLSIGTQLALAVAMQLSHKPQLLLLDEPVQGLDARARELMAETIRCVQETGCAVVLATHDLAFAGAVADQVFEIADRELRLLGGVRK